MPNEEKNIEQIAENLTDIEISELANAELRKRDAEIAQLRRDLAKAKLYSTADDESEEPTLTREEALKVISDGCTSNYDYAVAVCELCDREAEAGNPNPLGRDGEAVCQFFRDVIEECDGDKSRFTSVYQARLGADDPQIAMAYNKRKRGN